MNVAITRARYNLKLVGSIQADEIKVENCKNEGPKLLRKYISFAKTGKLDVKNSVKDDVAFDSPFEESVYNYLISQGYHVATQVGCSGYRIDLGIYHPNIDGVFVLGIECDGASYHSARTARERDRLRQTVLENLGWKFYRVWSTDWIKDPKNQKQLLKSAINSSITEYNNSNLK